MNNPRTKAFTWWLSALFVIALVMGPGPGMLLANSASAVLGIPLLYFWCIVWFLVMATIVVLAYVFVWKGDGESAS